MEEAPSTREGWMRRFKLHRFFQVRPALPVAVVMQWMRIRALKIVKNYLYTRKHLPIAEANDPIWQDIEKLLYRTKVADDDDDDNR